jgi:tetratricopeptide (TPR) repeat protein
VPLFRAFFEPFKRKYRVFMNYIASFEPGSDVEYKKNVLYTPQQLIDMLQAVEQEVQTNLTNASFCLKKANILITMGRYDEAQLLYERTIWLDPHIVFPYLALSILFRRRSLYADARMACDWAAQLAPKSSIVQIERAMILFEQNEEIASHYTHVSFEDRQKFEKELKEGSNSVESVLQRDAKNAMAYVAQSHAKRQMAVKAVFGGRHRQEAMTACDQAIKLDALLAEAYLAKAFAQVELGWHPEALLSINRFTELEPYDPIGYHLKQSLLERMGRKDEASMTLLEGAIKVGLFEGH